MASSLWMFARLAVCEPRPLPFLRFLLFLACCDERRLPS